MLDGGLPGNTIAGVGLTAVACTTLLPSEVTPPVGVVVGWVPFSRQTAKCAWDTLDGMGVGLCFSTSYKANCWHIPRGGTVVGPVWDPSPGGLEILFGPVAGSLVAQC